MVIEPLIVVLWSIISSKDTNVPLPTNRQAAGLFTRSSPLDSRMWKVHSLWPMNGWILSSAMIGMIERTHHLWIRKTCVSQYFKHIRDGTSTTHRLPSPPTVCSCAPWLGIVGEAKQPDDDKDNDNLGLGMIHKSIRRGQVKLLSGLLCAFIMNHGYIHVYMYIYIYLYIHVQWFMVMPTL